MTTLNPPKNGLLKMFHEKGLKIDEFSVQLSIKFDKFLYSNVSHIKYFYKNKDMFIFSDSIL